MTTNLFQDSKLKTELRTGLKKIGFKKPTPVQEQVIPKLLAGESVVVQAMTGSGKTHAYLLPVFNTVDPDLPQVQAVITAPSRELVEQLYQAARQLRDQSQLDIRIEKMAGGSDRGRQEEKLTRSKPQVIVATPGRLADFAAKKLLNFDALRFFIVDEADMTMDMGFLNTLGQIMHRFPAGYQFAAFSATIPVKLRNFLQKERKDLDFIVIDNPAVIAPTIQNDLLDIGSRDRKDILYQLLTLGQPYLALVFANTKEKVDEIAAYLNAQGLKAAKIHGGITQRERRRTLREVENGQFQYVVASDLAARGIDIDGVSLVINYELPRDLEFVIHRIGRTGRNGLSGHAITLITEEEMPRVLQLEKMGVKFDFKQLKNGTLVERKHYHARTNRRQHQGKLSGQTRGYIKKQKRKRKPGYKKKIKQAVRQGRAQRKRFDK
jgi:ATP-dependent RNA helicase CshB